MQIQTYQLRLVADATVPRFKRLVCSLVDVSLSDVFHHGVHPHSHTTGLGHDAWGTADAMIERLNDQGAFVPGLQPHHVGYNIVRPTTATRHSWRQTQPTVLLDRLFETVRDGVYFVDDLSYVQLREIAIARLQEMWCHGVARKLVGEMGRDFAGIRAFLKSVEPNIKLTGYDSLDQYDLGDVLRVDHFLTEDRLLLLHGLELQNFRIPEALSRLTDRDGRLRLASRIDGCCIEWRSRPDNKEATLKYKCLVDHDRVRWQPDIGVANAPRQQAREIAQDLGNGTGQYCFETSLGEMDRALDDPRLRLRFPWLRYGAAHVEWTPSAKLRHSAVPCYMVPKPLDADRTNECLQNTLREFGWKTSGRKEQLVRRIAQLLAEEYQRTESELDEFFGSRRFVKLKAGHLGWQRFPVLHDHTLNPSLLAMYCLRHMRGNVILEASHHNTSVTLTDLAEALLHRRVKLDGAFVEVL